MLTLGIIGAAHFTAKQAYPPQVVDPYWSSVQILVECEGSDGSTTFTDSSSFGRTITAFGNAQIEGNKLLLDGGGDGIRTPDNEGYNLGAGPFTVEMFITPDSLSGIRFHIGQWQHTGNLGWIVYQNEAALAFNASVDGFANTVVMSGGTLVADVEQHICVDFDGTKYRAYINGTMVASSTSVFTFNNSGNNLSIGTNSDINGFFFDGHMDNIRLTKGVARYASDSGFTVPAVPFPTS